MGWTIRREPTSVSLDLDNGGLWVMIDSDDLFGACLTTMNYMLRPSSSKYIHTYIFIMVVDSLRSIGTIRLGSIEY